MALPSPRLIRSTVLLTGLALAPSAAAEPDRARCIDAYEQSQQLRREGRLIAAEGELLVCVQRTCPDFVRPDCERWLAEVQGLRPSIVVAATDRDGKDAIDVRVFIDGELVAETLDGRAIPLDPGPHELRLEHADAPPKILSLVAQQGVKNRLVTVSWAPDPTPPSPPPPADRGHPIAAYVLGGLSLAAFGSFAAFGILGKAEADELKERCGEGAPAGGVCTEDEIDAARLKLIAADVSLGVGAGLFAAGLGLFIFHVASEPEGDATALQLQVTPTTGGGFAQVTVAF